MEKVSLNMTKKQSLASLVKEKDHMHFGKYKISQSPHHLNQYWIEHDDGQAGEFTKEDLDKLIATFFLNNF